MTGWRGIVLGIVAACLALAADPRAYLKLGADVDGTVVALKWADQPVRYFVTNRDAPNVTAVDLQRLATDAFATWAAVPHASMRRPSALTASASSASRRSPVRRSRSRRRPSRSTTERAPCARRTSPSTRRSTGRPFRVATRRITISALRCYTRSGISTASATRDSARRN
jgi:hypothetical protein